MSTGTSSAAQGRAALAFARAQIGTPYQWGGTGPNGYDCSGLTSTSWASAGITIPRTSRNQYRALTKVSYDDMRPGDLIFYGSSASSIHHVAMYAGNGKMVEAPRAGLDVREVTVRWRGAMPYAARP